MVGTRFFEHNLAVYVFTSSSSGASVRQTKIPALGYRRWAKWNRSEPRNQLNRVSVVRLRVRTE